MNGDENMQFYKMPLAAVMMGLALSGNGHANSQAAEKQVEQKTQSVTALSHKYMMLKQQQAALQSKFNRLEADYQALILQNKSFRNPLSLSGIRDWKRLQKLQGSAIYGQDAKHTYLGVLDFYGTHKDSIFNPKSAFSQVQNPISIWNQRGYFGAMNAPFSISNPVATTAPVLKKQGRLNGVISSNAYLAGVSVVDPIWLKQVQPVLVKYYKKK